MDKIVNFETLNNSKTKLISHKIWVQKILEIAHCGSQWGNLKIFLIQDSIDEKGNIEEILIDEENSRKDEDLNKVCRVCILKVKTTLCGNLEIFLIQDSIDEKEDIPMSPQESLDDIKEIGLDEENSIKDENLNKVWKHRVEI